MRKGRRGMMQAMDAVFSDLPDGFDADDLRHLSTSNPQGKAFRCTVCPRGFASNEALQMHRRAKHPPIDLAAARSSDGGQR